MNYKSKMKKQRFMCELLFPVVAYVTLIDTYKDSRDINPRRISLGRQDTETPEEQRRISRKRQKWKSMRG